MMAAEKEHTNESDAKHVRTCVGCGSKDDPAALVRVVFDVVSESVVVDASGKSFGRGAHVHPTPKCVQNACKSGFSKAFRTNVKASAADLSKDIAAALDRRIEGLVVAARGAGALAVGSDKALAAVRDGVPLALVAKDAASIAEKTEIVQAVGEGRAVVWRDKLGIGRVVDRTDVAIVAVENTGIARAIRAAALAIASLESGQDSARDATPESGQAADAADGSEAR